MKFELPDELKISNKSVISIISISAICGLISSLFSYFKLDSLETSYRIIIILSIFLFVSIIDIFILYLRDRDRQYKLSCIKFIADFLQDNISKLISETDDIKKSVNSLSKILKQIEIDLKLNSKS